MRTKSTTLVRYYVMGATPMVIGVAPIMQYTHMRNKR